MEKNCLLFKTSGIYVIRSILDNKKYIGSTINLLDRYNKHNRQLKLNINECLKLQNYVNKYGINNVLFDVLEFCEKEKLIEREQYYFDKLKPELNICKKANSTFGRTLSEESKKKISLSKIGKPGWNKGIPMLDHVKEAIRKSNKNRKISEETKGKLRRENIGNKYAFGYQWPEERKKSFAKLMSKPVMQYDLNGMFINEYNSRIEAGRQNNIDPENISYCIIGKWKTAGGFIWADAKQILST
jgi:group I intron endonuclease